jgi:hypothetical protein
MSVAISTGDWLDLNAAMARSRWGCDLLPGGAPRCRRGQLTHDLVGAVLGPLNTSVRSIPVFCRNRVSNAAFSAGHMGDALVDPLDGGCGGVTDTSAGLVR